MNKNKQFNKRGGFRGGRGGGGRGGGGRGGGGWGANRGWRGGYFNNRNGDNFGPRNENYGGNFGGPGGNRFRNEGNPNWQKRQTRETPGKRLSEVDIGVTEYISSLKGFNGIIKSRYSDFHVSEVNEQGQIAKLTDRNPPEPPKEETVDEDEDLLLSKYNLEILPMETWDKINSLAVSTDKTNEKVEVDMTGASKEMRTKIHDAVKKAFGDSIVGSTVTEGEKKFVRFEKYRKGVRIDTRVKWVWPGEYVYFVVYKENCDTMDAAGRIAERLGVHVKPSMLGYAGTKDRRAKTSQWFSAKKIDPRKLANSCNMLRDISIGNYSFHDVPLKLGMLKGNRFRIALRNVTADDATIAEACTHLKEHGFINYYGLQRFGTRYETPTYNIGLKLLQSNYKEAIAAILEARSGPLEAALREYAARGAGAALRALPPRTAHAHSETRLLRALADHPADLQGALNKLARNMRLLYLHSYQSLIWNRAASTRIQRYGLTPAVGDLVPLRRLQSDDDDDFEGAPDSDSEEAQAEDEEEEMDTETNNKPTEKLTEKERNKQVYESKLKIPVQALTQEDVDSGKYSITDIVLPLPGYNIEYPANMVDYYEELLAKDGLTMHLRHKVKNYSMSGGYRHVAVRPLEVSWRGARYSDPFTDLIASDRDELEGRPLPQDKEDGKYKALLLTLTLPSSCYATMALRELLKVDTSSDFQALQNNYHKRRRDSKTGEKLSESEGESKRPRESEKEKTSEAEAKKVADNDSQTKIEKEEDSNTKKETEEDSKTKKETEEDSKITEDSESAKEKEDEDMNVDNTTEENKE